jgi:hypothetical protein
MDDVKLFRLGPRPLASLSENAGDCPKFAIGRELSEDCLPLRGGFRSGTYFPAVIGRSLAASKRSTVNSGAPA